MRFKTIYEANNFDEVKLSKEFRDIASTIMSNLRYEIEDEKKKAKEYKPHSTYGHINTRKSDKKIKDMSDELKNLKDLYDKAASGSNYSKIPLWIDNLKQKYNF